MKRGLLPLAAFLAIAAFLGVGLFLDPRSVPSPLIGKPAPDFSAPRLYAPEKMLSKQDLLGRVAVVNVFASWCVACREEHPYVAALAETVPVFGINYKDTREDAQAWLAKYGNAYRAIAYDPEGRLGLDWGVYGVPETFILDRQGIIRHKHIGAIDAEALGEELLPLIETLRREARGPRSPS